MTPNDVFVWYLPDPTHWIRCEIVFRIGSLVSIETYDGEQVANLRVRRVGGAELCQ